MNVVCIADRESGTGLRLAGMEVREAENRSEALDALREFLRRRDTGVLLVTSRAASFIRAELDGLPETVTGPLLLEIPSRTETGGTPATVELLRKAMGVEPEGR